MWKAGTRYRFGVRSSVGVDFGGAGSAVNYAMTATAWVSVVQPGPERVVLYLRLSDTILTNRVTGGGPLDSVAEDIQRGGAVIVLVDGVLSEFGTRKGMSSPARATYKHLASALQAKLLPSSSAAEVEEYDGTGKYVARYIPEQSGQGYAKTKLRYTTMVGVQPGLAGGTSPLRAEILKSEGHVGFDVERGLAEVRLSDEVAIRGAEIPVHSSTSLDLKLERTEPEGDLDLSARAAEVPLLAASEPDPERPPAEALDQARAQGAKFRDILARVKVSQDRLNSSSTHRRTAGSATPGEHSATDDDPDSAEVRKQFASLVGAIRVQPEAVPDSVKMIKAGSPLAPVLLDALGSASNPATEAALIDLAHSSNAEVAKRALFALSRQPRPGPKSIDVMFAVLAERAYDQTAMYALAAYSRIFRDAGNIEQADSLGLFLTKQLARAPGPTKRAIALHAIEGAAYAGAVSEVLKLVTDRDDTIRTAAIRALGPMKDPVVDDILVSKLASDPSPESRLAVILAARSRPQSIKVAGAIARIFRDSDTTVRFRAVELFVSWLPKQPDLRKLLERIASTDPEAKVRDLAKSAL